MKRILGIFMAFTLMLLSAMVFGAGQKEAGAAVSGKGLGNYPEKPITFVVAYAAGGGTDILARVIQKGLKDSGAIKVPVIVQNIDGGGSLIGMREVLNAKPDGYKFLFHHKTALIAPVYGKAEFTYKDFKPVAQFGSTPMVYIVHKDSSFNTLMDVMKAAEKTKIKMGTVPGSTIDVLNALVVDAYGKKDPFILVNSGGGSQRLQMILGKQLDAAPFSLAEYLQYKAQDIKAIALMDVKKSPSLPDLSTGIEQGINAEFSQTHNLLAPKDTPDEIIDFISKAVEKALQTPEVGDIMKKQSLTADFIGGADFAKKFMSDGEKITKIVQEMLLQR